MVFLIRKNLIVMAWVCFNFTGFVSAQPDDTLTITQFIKKYDFQVETHTYETKDGYILTAYRIPPKTPSKNVVLLAHGMGGNAENYLSQGPSGCLAFFLSEQGYDVWLFNARGTTHSRKHRLLNINVQRKKYWNFSWHEIAVYDLPATIDYILAKTGVKQLFYVGHSQGTTTLFVMLSELPEMNKKLKVAGLLAPSAFLFYSQSPLLSFGVKFYGLGERLASMFGYYELPIPNSPMLNNILTMLCRPETMHEICLDVIYLIGGTHSGLLNASLVPSMVHFLPSGFSVKQAWHYAQIIIARDFRKYDHGRTKNMQLYNSTVPPSYNLTNVHVPIALFYAPDDPYGNPKMINELTKHISNVVLKYQVPIDRWNHLDYILAYNAKEVIYDHLYKVFEQYEDK